MHNQQFLVSRSNLNEHTLQELALPPLESNDLILTVESFALTANNITYAVAGDQMGYWQFFPVDDQWGRVPVWGFATVESSEHPDVAVGQRYYGYFPMGQRLHVHARVGKHHMTDDAPHRAKLPAVYNQYVPAGAADTVTDAQQMLFRPLFMTSWLLDDFLAHNAMFGATQIVLTSASSKTSLGLANELAKRSAVDVVGLTSPANVGFVEALGTYDRVLPYDRVGDLPKVPTASVDMAGNGAVLAAIHNHLDDLLKHSCLVGATHWENRSGAQDMAGPKPELFFAPNHIRDRSAEWGPGGIEQRFEPAWTDFVKKTEGWLEARYVNLRDLGSTYAAVLAGDVAPDIGYIIRPNDE